MRLRMTIAALCLSLGLALAARSALACEGGSKASSDQDSRQASADSKDAKGSK